MVAYETNVPSFISIYDYNYVNKILKKLMVVAELLISQPTILKLITINNQ